MEFIDVAGRSRETVRIGFTGFVKCSSSPIVSTWFHGVRCRPIKNRMPRDFGTHTSLPNPANRGLWLLISDLLHDGQLKLHISGNGVATMSSVTWLRAKHGMLLSLLAAAITLVCTSIGHLSLAGDAEQSSQGLRGILSEFVPIGLLEDDFLTLGDSWSS